MSARWITGGSRRRRWAAAAVISVAAFLGAAAALANTISIGPASMEGNITAQPGDWMSVGWHFKYGGNHPASTVKFVGTTFSFHVTCANGSTPSQNPYVMNVPDKSYSVAANDTNYIPWNDQDIASSFQYAAQVPALCGAGIGMNMGDGATFFSDVQSTDTADELTLQFHYRDPNAKGKGNVNCSDPAQNPDPGNSAVCGASMSPTAKVTPDPIEAPALSLTKSANPTTYTHAGQSVVYSYVVTNSGNVAFAGPVTVTDDRATVTCPAGGLAVGASTTCAATYAITAADMTAGSVTNHATAHANGTDSNQATATVTLAAQPALSLVKSANPTTYDHVGQTIAYSYVVTNSGNVALAGPVTVTDDKATVTCPAGGLAPTVSMTCAATYAITQADIDAGSVVNHATAHANGTDSNPDTKTVTATQRRALTLQKSAAPTVYSSVGQTISYSYLVTNGGNVGLAGPVTVTDDKASVTCPAGGLAAGASITCTATYAITQADVDAGHVTNVAQAHAEQINSNTDTKTVTAEASSGLSLVKSATPSTYGAVGQTISYSYVVTNTGNLTLAGPITVSDDKATVTCPSGGLAPGGSITCTATYTITQADLDAGHVTNIAQAHAGELTSNTDTKTVTAAQTKTLSLAKSASPGTYSSSGQTIAYSYVVTNTGNVALAGPVTVTDDKATVTCPGGGLAPGASMTCSASYTITSGDVGAASVTNHATAHANGVDSNQATATVTKPSTPPPPPPGSPALSLTKSATPTTYDHVGQTITYGYVVSNVGSALLVGPVTVTDDRATVTCPSVGLAAGATVSCTATYVITQADMTAGSVTNHATAHANGISSNQATRTVTAAPRIDLAITKIATPASVAVGGTLTWSMTVSNKGPSAATNVVVRDPLPAGSTYVSATTTQGTCGVATGVLECRLGTVAAGASVRVTLVTKPTATGQQANTATVTATEPDPNTADNTARAVANVTGAFKPPATAKPKPLCYSVAAVAPKVLVVGRFSPLEVIVVAARKPAAGVHVRLTGPGVNRLSGKSDSRGRVVVRLRPTTPGLLRVAPATVRVCGALRVGMTGAFTPPVTG